MRNNWPEAVRRSPLIAWARAAAILPKHSDRATWVLAFRPDSLGATLADPAVSGAEAASFQLNVLRELRVLRGGSGGRGDRL